MKIIAHNDLEVYQIAFEAAMRIFTITQAFPKEERYSLTDQVRRSSRSVCANLAEAFYWRKYPKNFASRLANAIAEAGETRVWLEFAGKCEYIANKERLTLDQTYGLIIGKLIVMYNQPEKWTI